MVPEAPARQQDNDIAKISQETHDSFPVLVVEDHPVTRSYLEKNLTDAGYEVTLATNGREAFEKFKSKFFPIVITDWMMPEMDGLELCVAIRAQNFPRYTFIIMLTALDTSADLLTGLRAGADEYLTKPFNPVELLVRLNTGRRILNFEASLRRAYDEIYLLSITDPLTKIYNRGYITSRLPDEIARSRRYHRPLAAIMCDIDNFKAINDSHGHHAGDTVLRDFAACLKGTTRRDVDWLARYGGEEFLIVLPETNFEGAMILAERLRQRVAEMEILVEKTPISLTASFGVTGFDRFAREAVTPELLLRQADGHLYQAKRAGRNRVVGAPLPLL